MRISRISPEDAPMKWTPLFVALAALLLTAEPPKRVPPEAAKTVARINERRKIAGLKPVEFDAELSDGCEKHSKYLVLNDNRVWTEKGFDSHDEVEAYSGFTKEGRKAGKSGVISWQ